MLSVPVQLIAWKGRPQNDLLCVERDVKQLLTRLFVLRCYMLSLSSSDGRIFLNVAMSTIERQYSREVAFFKA